MYNMLLIIETDLFSCKQHVGAITFSWKKHRETQKEPLLCIAYHMLGMISHDWLGYQKVVTTFFGRLCPTDYTLMPVTGPRNKT